MAEATNAKKTRLVTVFYDEFRLGCQCLEPIFKNLLKTGLYAVFRRFFPAREG